MCVEGLKTKECLRNMLRAMSLLFHCKESVVIAAFHLALSLYSGPPGESSGDPTALLLRAVLFLHFAPFLQPRMNPLTLARVLLKKGPV